MEIDKWIGPYAVLAFPCIDGSKRIYFNVILYTPGTSPKSVPPVFDKTVYIVNNSAGRRLVYGLTRSLINYVEQLEIRKGTEVVIEVQGGCELAELPFCDNGPEWTIEDAKPQKRLKPALPMREVHISS